MMLPGTYSCLFLIKSLRFEHRPAGAPSFPAQLPDACLSHVPSCLTHGPSCVTQQRPAAVTSAEAGKRGLFTRSCLHAGKLQSTDPCRVGSTHMRVYRRQSHACVLTPPINNLQRRDLTPSTPARLQALLNELEMMARLEHRNIVNFVEFFLQDDAAAKHYGACIIVMHLLAGPDMMDHIDDVGGFSRASARVRSCHCVLQQRRGSFTSTAGKGIDRSLCACGCLCSRAPLSFVACQ